jgi:hypothetical protein
MRHILIAAGALAVVAAFSGGTAQAGEGPWCAVVEAGTGNMYWDCQYYSVQTCRAHVVAGNRGFCNPNPRYGYRERGRYKPHRYRYRS